PTKSRERLRNDHLHFLWNHRWESDKNPSGFLRLLAALKDHKKNFKIILLGDSFNNLSAQDQKKIDQFEQQIVWKGYAEDRNDYERLLLQADVIPVTSNQEFFGVSVIEAIAHDCFPLLPDRLVYPEHIPTSKASEHIYKSYDELLQMSLKLINEFDQGVDISSDLNVSRYRWEEQIQNYDNRFEEIIKKKYDLARTL
ncbi:MAG: glycosyltransferase, partial [Bacteroidia bacterium]|nr:glycosyltransferase [Bacteroidia bacterium]